MGRPKRAAARAAEAEAEANKKAKSGLAVGDQLPDDLPELETDATVGKDSKTLKLQDVAKESGIVVFVYPKANTPGCTKQALGFNAKLEEFASLGYKVFGLSADRPKPQSNWKAKNSFKYTLLSDPQSTVISVFGFSKSGKGIHRSHIVIEKGGKVKDVRLGVKPDASVVLALETVKSAPGEPLPAEPATAPQLEANGVQEEPAVEEPEAAAEAAPETAAQPSTEEPVEEASKPDEPEGGEVKEEAGEPLAAAADGAEKAVEVPAAAEAADDKPAEPPADAEAQAETPAEALAEAPAAADPVPDKAPEEATAEETVPEDKPEG